MLRILKITNSFLPRHIIIIIHDLIVITAAFPLAVLVRGDFHLAQWQMEPLPYGTIIIFLIAALVFSWLGLHRRIWSHASPNDFIEIAKAVTIIVTIFVVVMFLFGRMDGVPRGAIPILWCLALAGLCGSRALYSSRRGHQARTQSSGQSDKDIKRVLLVGDGSAASLVLNLLDRAGSNQSEVVGLVAGAHNRGRTLDGMPLVGGIEQIKFILAGLEARGLKPNRIIVTSPRHELGKEQVTQLIEEAKSAGIAVDDLLDLIRLTSEDNVVQGPTPSRFARPEPAAKLPVLPYHHVRRIVDLVLSGLTLGLLSPLMLVLMMAVQVTTGSPIWFDQRRQGKNLRDFMLHKFRTMNDPMAPDGRLLTDDERVTLVGNILRRTRLDELPQLWNVFVGHMSLIGPRPLLPRDLPDVDDDMMRERFSVRPGITGWAQVNGGKQLTPEQKFALDLYYIRNASPLLDAKIVAMTIRMMLFGEEINPIEIRRAEAAAAATLRSKRSGQPIKQLASTSSWA